MIIYIHTYMYNNHMIEFLQSAPLEGHNVIGGQIKSQFFIGMLP